MESNAQALQTQTMQNNQAPTQGSVPVVTPYSPSQMQHAPKSATPNFVSMLKKMTLGCLVVVILGIVAFAALYLTEVDTKLATITLEGYVYSELTEEPIAGATLSSDGSIVATTDETGYYLVSKLDIGKLTLIVSADKYLESVQEIDITRSMFNYENKKDFTLSSTSIAVIRGKLLIPEDSKKGLSSDESLYVGEEKITIKSDGTFEIVGISTGTQSLKFASPNYKDFEQLLTINPEVKILDPIPLQITGNVEGEITSYIREDIVSNIQFLVNNVRPEQVEIDRETALFTIHDLEVGKDYTIRVQAEGYNERDYSITINQGTNKLFDFRIVESGKVIYKTRKVDQKSSQFYISNLDGTDEKQLSSIEKWDPQNSAYDESSNKIYFQTDHDRERTNMSDYLSLVYSINGLSGELERVTQNTNNLGYLYPNYNAGIMLNVTKPDKRENYYDWEIISLAGEERKQIKRTETEFISQAFISDDGASMYYVSEENGIEGERLYRMDLATKSSRLLLESENLTLYDVSSEGRRALVSAKNDRTNFEDFIVYDTDSSELRTVIANHIGQGYRFLQNSSNEIIYWKKDGGRENVFRYFYEENNEEQITKLSAADDIETIFEQGEFLFYITNKGLYVIDVDEPSSMKLVQMGEIMY